MTLRQQEINAWISGLMPDVDLSNLQYLQADASQRKYLRLQLASNSYIIMDTKPNQELLNFTNIARIFHKHDLNVPEIINSNYELGLLLISDLGSITYQDALSNATPGRADHLYFDAIKSLIKLQQIDPIQADYLFGSMDANYIQIRMDIFCEWYLKTHLGLTIDSNINGMLLRMQKLFSQVFISSPTHLVHVDYHCRNLMLTDSNNPGILDFQDAMQGPYVYDLVSLFQDAYITWDRPRIESWVNMYRELAITAGLIPQLSLEEVLWTFDLVGLQRHIKNLGIFARLHHRDQKSSYINDMPTLLRYISSTCNRYSELNWLSEFIVEAVQG